MVQYIISNNVKYPILLNNFVIGKVQYETGYGFEVISELDKKLWLYEPLIWHSLVQGHLVAKEPLKIERKDMPLILNDNDIYSKFIELIPTFFPVPDKEEVQDSKKK